MLAVYFPFWYFNWQLVIVYLWDYDLLSSVPEGKRCMYMATGMKVNLALTVLKSMWTLYCCSWYYSFSFSLASNFQNRKVECNISIKEQVRNLFHFGLTYVSNTVLCKRLLYSVIHMFNNYLSMYMLHFNNANLLS